MLVPDLPYNNPLSSIAIDDAIEWLRLTPQRTALDVGCGNGEILRRIVDRFGCRGIGVDLETELIVRARTCLAAHADRVELHAGDVHDLDFDAAPVHAAVCIGSTHAFGKPGDAFSSTLRALSGIVEPGGVLLVGEGYWRQPPPDAYLAATGMGADDFRTHAANVETGEQQGLIPLSAATSSHADWDRFESRFWQAAEEHLHARPDDAAALADAEHWRAWRRAYLRWGRETLGFGLYLFAVPSPR